MGFKWGSFLGSAAQSAMNTYVGLSQIQNMKEASVRAEAREKREQGAYDQNQQYLDAAQELMGSGAMSDTTSSAPQEFAQPMKFNGSLSGSMPPAMDYGVQPPVQQPSVESAKTSAVSPDKIPDWYWNSDAAAATSDVAPARSVVQTNQAQLKAPKSLQGQVDYKRLVEETARAEGVDPKVAVQIMRRESSGDPNAKNPQPGQTAGGLFQIIDKTWVGLYRKYMPEQAAGRSDKELIKDKLDPELNASLGIKYLKEGQAGLKAGDAGSIYSWHLLGQDKATKLKQLAQTNPDMPLDEAGKAVAGSKAWSNYKKKNPGVFNLAGTVGEWFTKLGDHIMGFGVSKAVAKPTPPVTSDPVEIIGQHAPPNLNIGKVDTGEVMYLPGVYDSPQAPARAAMAPQGSSGSMIPPAYNPNMAPGVTPAPQAPYAPAPGAVARPGVVTPRGSGPVVPGASPVAMGETPYPVQPPGGPVVPGLRPGVVAPTGAGPIPYGEMPPTAGITPTPQAPLGAILYRMRRPDVPPGMPGSAQAIAQAPYAPNPGAGLPAPSASGGMQAEPGVRPDVPPVAQGGGAIDPGVFNQMPQPQAMAEPGRAPVDTITNPQSYERNTVPAKSARPVVKSAGGIEAQTSTTPAPQAPAQVSVAPVMRPPSMLNPSGVVSVDSILKEQTLPGSPLNRPMGEPQAPYAGAPQQPQRVMSHREMENRAPVSAATPGAMAGQTPAPQAPIAQVPEGGGQASAPGAQPRTSVPMGERPEGRAVLGTTPTPQQPYVPVEYAGQSNWTPQMMWQNASVPRSGNSQQMPARQRAPQLAQRFEQMAVLALKYGKGADAVHYATAAREYAKYAAETRRQEANDGLMNIGRSFMVHRDPNKLASDLTKWSQNIDDGHDGSVTVNPDGSFSVTYADQQTQVPFVQKTYADAQSMLSDVIAMSSPEQWQRHVRDKILNEAGLAQMQHYKTQTESLQQDVDRKQRVNAVGNELIAMDPEKTDPKVYKQKEREYALLASGRLPSEGKTQAEWKSSTIENNGGKRTVYARNGQPPEYQLGDDGQWYPINFDLDADKAFYQQYSKEATAYNIQRVMRGQGFESRVEYFSPVVTGPNGQPIGFRNPIELIEAARAAARAKNPKATPPGDPSRPAFQDNPMQYYGN